MWILALALACAPGGEPRSASPTGTTATPQPTATTSPEPTPTPGCDVIATAWTAEQTPADAWLTLDGPWWSLGPAGALDQDPFLVGVNAESEARILALDPTGAVVSSTLFDLDAGAAGAVGDVTGDGFPDLATGRGFDVFGSGGSVALWAGDGAGGVAPGPVYDLVGSRVPYGFDTTDGAFLVGTFWRTDEPDLVWRITGAPARGQIAVAADLELSLPTSGYGASPAFAGDLDGDGLTEIAVVSGFSAHLFGGADAGALTDADAAATYTSTSFVGGIAVALGDLDGDGFDDVAFAAGRDYYSAEIQMISGSEPLSGGPIGRVASRVWHGGNAPTDLLTTLTPVDDLDGDGARDLAFVSDLDGTTTDVRFVSGAATGTVDVPEASVGGIAWADQSEVHNPLPWLVAADGVGDCASELFVAGDDGAWVFSPVL